MDNRRNLDEKKKVILPRIRNYYLKDMIVRDICMQ